MKPRTTSYKKRRFIFLVFLSFSLFVFPVYDFFEHRNTKQTTDQTQTLGSIHTQNAVDSLGKIAVKNAMSREGYSRNQFGSGWARVNGCDTRNLILQRDLIDVQIDPENNCIVLSGILQNDPYTEKQIVFQRGSQTSSAVQIEHIVALSDAWQKGAQLLDANSRTAFSNDGLNLIAVDGPANMQKGDKDAANWLPVKSYRCKYVARQIAVKLEYELWVTPSEHNAMKRVLATCPNQQLPINRDE